MNPTTVALIGLLSGMAGALIIEGLKLAYRTWQAGQQPATRVLASYQAAPEITSSPPDTPTAERTEAVPFEDIAASAAPPAQPEPSRAADETTEVRPPAPRRSEPPVVAPVNAAISETDLQPGDAPAAPPARDDGHPRHPIMIYSQEDSILATLENSEEVEAVLRASRGSPGQGGLGTGGLGTGRRPSKRKPAPEPELAAPEPEHPVPETPEVPRPELRKSLEEQAAAMPAGFPLWAVYAVLGASVVLALVFLFLALQPLLAR